MSTHQSICVLFLILMQQAKNRTFECVLSQVSHMAFAY